MVHAAPVAFGHVPPDSMPGMWAEIMTLLDDAVQAGGYRWGEVSDDLRTARAQLWVTTSPEPVAAMVTRIDGDTLEVWLAGGAVLSTSVPFLETAIEASKQAGTTNGRIIGRKGWGRVLKPFGWRREGDELVKEWANG